MWKIYFCEIKKVYHKLLKCLYHFSHPVSRELLPIVMYVVIIFWRAINFTFQLTLPYFERKYILFAKTCLNRNSFQVIVAFFFLKITTSIVELQTITSYLKCPTIHKLHKRIFIFLQIITYSVTSWFYEFKNN